MKRSTFVAAALAAALLPLAATAQTDWPNKPVNMVVPYPPGGLNDAVARVYADKLTAIFLRPRCSTLQELPRILVCRHD